MRSCTADVTAFGVVLRIEQVFTQSPLGSFQRSHCTGCENFLFSTKHVVVHPDVVPAWSTPLTAAGCALCFACRVLYRVYRRRSLCDTCVTSDGDGESSISSPHCSATIARIAFVSRRPLHRRGR